MAKRWWWVIGAVMLVVVAGLVWWAWAWYQGTQREEASDLPTRTPAPSASVSATPATPVPVKLQKVVGGLSKVTVIAHIPDDSRLYVAEQGGLVKIVKDGAVVAKPFLDLSKRVRSDSELGLLGLAFDPKFADNHYVYAYYSKPDLTGVVSRFTASADGTGVDIGSEKVLLTQADKYPNHNGGPLVFGPKDGYLYIGFGDGGGTGDPDGNGQRMSTWLGKVLRIDVHKGDPYAVPADNPFVGTGAKPEIWDLGLRNPWKLSFDQADGRLVIADVGQGLHEEVNLEAAGQGGKNYGWRCYEGSHAYNVAGCGAKSAFTWPVLEYDHTAKRCSITGGYVYRGTAVPAWDGRYFYGDYCTGEIWSTVLGKAGEAAKLELDSDFKISTFGEGADGELYVVDYGGGTLYRLVGR